MISKEEMKEALRVGDDRTVIEYIEQLENKVREVEVQRNELATELSENEDDKQKLIDKVENDITTSEIECRNREKFREDVYGHIKYKAINNYAQEILSILKGGK